MKNKLVSLHKYFINASHQKQEFEEALGQELRNEDIFIIFFPKISIWYSCLQVVVEGWESLGLSSPEVDALLLNETNKSLLRRFRNGTFHYQEDYNNLKQMEMIQAKDIVPWVRDLHDTIGMAILNKIKTVE